MKDRSEVEGGKGEGKGESEGEKGIEEERKRRK